VSATKRGGKRSIADYYPTPAWCVRRLLEAVELPGGAWLEPSAGDGAIIRAVNACRTDVRFTGCELRNECRADLINAGADTIVGDFLRDHLLQTPRFKVAILNPPFTHAREFIDRCKRHAGYVVALERLNFLGSEERSAWSRECMPDVYVLPNRPSFTGEGTDSIEYAWFVWTPERGRKSGRMQVLASTPAAERRVSKPKLPAFFGAA
jgi:hypothetical protein